jgi:guanylate kinase
MSASRETPESINTSLEFLRELEDTYQSNSSVPLEIRDQSLTAIAGPTGAGKSTLTRKIKELDPEIHEVGSTITRSLRKEDPDGYVSVTYAEFKSMADNGEFLNFNVVGDNAYGTRPSGLSSKYNIGPILTKSVEALMNSGLRRFNVAYVVVNGQTYEKQLLDSRADFTDFAPRAAEGHKSIEFARDNISADWLHFVENSQNPEKLTKAAQKIISLTRGNSPDTLTSEFMTTDQTLRHLDEMQAALDRVSRRVS